MKPIRLPPQTAEQIAVLDELYQTTKDVRLRQRAQLVLLAAEKNMVAHEIGDIVRLNEQSVRRWLRRYMAEGIEGLHDQPRPGAVPVVTAAYRTQMVAAVRRRPRSLDLPFSMWKRHPAGCRRCECGVRRTNPPLNRRPSAATNDLAPNRGR